MICEGHAEVKWLKAENRGLLEDVEVVHPATTFFAGVRDPEVVALGDIVRRVSRSRHCNTTVSPTFETSFPLTVTVRPGWL